MTDVVRVGPGQISRLANQRMVPMRDGVRLATDVYLPGGDETPGPVLLTRLPYDKSGRFTPIDLYAEYMMERGYRVVAQDVRGKFRSEGERQIWAHEALDGYDTIDWISKQPWCDGSVAMWGNSYYGFTQFAAMTMQHPALKAIAPRLTGTTLGEPHLAAPGAGSRGVEWTVTYTYLLNFYQVNDNLFWDIDWTRRPYIDQIRAFIDEYGGGSNRSFDQWYPRPHVLPRFRNVPTPFDARPVPTLFTIGWWDNCAPCAWLDVEAMQARPAWEDNLHLLIESIDHYSYELHSDDRVEKATDEQWRARIPRLLDPTLEFFDVFVRGRGRADSIPKVSYEVANTSGKRQAVQWPPVGVRTRTLNSTAEGGLRISQPGSCGSAVEPGAAQATRTWVHDPENPVASAAPDPFKYLLDPGDETAVGEHPGVVRLVSEPLTEDLELVGRVTAAGTFWSTGPNMDLFVRLYDVDEEGRPVRIARGDLHLLHPEEPQAVDIRMEYAGYRVPAGHRLRFDVASSDAPEFVPQPGTGEDPWSAATTCTNDQSMIVGGPNGLIIRFEEFPAHHD